MLRDRGCWWPKWQKSSPIPPTCHQHISLLTSVTNIAVTNVAGKGSTTPIQCIKASFEKFLLFVLNHSHAFFNLILPPTSELTQPTEVPPPSDELQDLLFSRIENMIADMEFADDHSLEDTLDFLARRYTDGSV